MGMDSRLMEVLKAWRAGLIDGEFVSDSSLNVLHSHIVNLETEFVNKIFNNESVAKSKNIPEDGTLFKSRI